MKTVDLIQVSALLGAVFPLLAALFKQSGLSKKTNTVICVALAGIQSAALLISQGALTPENWGTSFVLLYTTAGATFKNLWQPIGVEGWLKDLTSFVKKEGVVAAPSTTAVAPVDVVDTAVLDAGAHPALPPVEEDLSRGTDGAAG